MWPSNERKKLIAAALEKLQNFVWLPPETLKILLVKIPESSPGGSGQGMRHVIILKSSRAFSIAHSKGLLSRRKDLRRILSQLRSGHSFPSSQPALVPLSHLKCRSGEPVLKGQSFKGIGGWRMLQCR